MSLTRARRHQVINSVVAHVRRNGGTITREGIALHTGIAKRDVRNYVDHWIACGFLAVKVQAKNPDDRVYELGSNVEPEHKAVSVDAQDRDIIVAQLEHGPLHTSEVSDLLSDGDVSYGPEKTVAILRTLGELKLVRQRFDRKWEPYGACAKRVISMVRRQDINRATLKRVTALAPAESKVVLEELAAEGWIIGRSTTYTMGPKFLEAAQ